MLAYRHAFYFTDTAFSNNLRQSRRALVRFSSKTELILCGTTRCGRDDDLDGNISRSPSFLICGN